MTVSDVQRRQDWLLERTEALVFTTVVLCFADVSSDFWLISFWYSRGHWWWASLVLVPTILSGLFLWFFPTTPTTLLSPSSTDNGRGSGGVTIFKCVTLVLHVLGCGVLVHVIRYLYEGVWRKNVDPDINDLMRAIEYEVYYESVPSLVVTGYTVVLGIWTDRDVPSLGFMTGVSIVCSIASITNYTVLDIRRSSLGLKVHLPIFAMKYAEIFQRLFVPALVVVLFKVEHAVVVYSAVYFLTFVFHFDRFLEAYKETREEKYEAFSCCRTILYFIWDTVLIIWEIVIRTARFQLTEGDDVLFKVYGKDSTLLQSVSRYRGLILSIFYVYTPTIWLIKTDSDCENCNMKIVLCSLLLVAFFIQLWQYLPYFSQEHVDHCEECPDLRGNQKISIEIQDQIEFRSSLMLMRIRTPSRLPVYEDKNSSEHISGSSGSEDSVVCVTNVPQLLRELSGGYVTPSINQLQRETNDHCVEFVKQSNDYISNNLKVPRRIHLSNIN